MTWTEALLWSICRAGFVAVIGVFIAQFVRTCLPRRQRQLQILTWGVILLPFFVPSLVTGYCFRDTSMSLVHSPWLRELLYGCIVLMQTVPVAVVVLEFSPPAEATSSSLFVSTQLRLELKERLRIWLRSAAQYKIAAGCLLFLLVFQEADLAALMQASGWTEWMFTKHVGGLHWQETLRLTTVPVLIQLPFLFPVLIWLQRAQSSGTAPSDTERRHSPVLRIAGWVWIAAANLLVVLLPAWQIFQGVKIGADNLASQPSLFRELGDALLIAATTAILAIGVFKGFQTLSRKQHRSITLVCLFVILLPGLLGNLALGLLIAGIFQTEAFHFAYDTPLPLILGEVAMILPRTFVLLHSLMQLNTLSSVHWISLMRRGDQQIQHTAGELKWQTNGIIWFAAISILSFWAYFEVMLPSILAMPGLAPIGWVLYNHLHYGRIAAIGAKLAFALGVPFVLAGTFLITRRYLARIVRI